MTRKTPSENVDLARKTAAAAAADLGSPAPAAASAPTSLVGRAAFVVDTSAAGIVVRTAFVCDNGQVLEIPAVFPDLGYALQQIDHLRQIVIDRFAQAAQVGVQVIAAQGQGPDAAPAAARADSAPAVSADAPIPA